MKTSIQLPAAEFVADLHERIASFFSTATTAEIEDLLAKANYEVYKDVTAKVIETHRAADVFGVAYCGIYLRSNAQPLKYFVPQELRRISSPRASFEDLPLAA